MEDLVNLDEIAYIRFASVYRQFKDNVFLKELRDIVDKAKSSSPDSEKLKRRSFFERKSAKNPTKKYFSAVIDSPLSDQEKEVLTFLYQPIVGANAFSLYWLLLSGNNRLRGEWLAVSCRFN